MTDDSKSSTREEQARRLADSLKPQLGAFCPLLAERDVVELMLNADGRRWVDRLGQPMTEVGKIPSPVAASFIPTVASTLRRAVTPIPAVVSASVPTIRHQASAGTCRIDSLPGSRLRRRAGGA